MSLPTIESSHVIYTATAIQGFKHPEIPVINLALEILNAVEGYLWRYIRGSGLAYGSSLELDVEAGLLHFTLSRSSNVMKALEEAAFVIRGLVDGSIDLPDTTVTAAISSIVYRVTRGVSSPSAAAAECFINQAFKGVSKSHQIDYLGKYQTIKKEEILAALKKHVLPVFDAASSVAIVVTAPGNTQSIGEGLTGLGFNVVQKELQVDPTDVENGESGTEGNSDSEGSV